MRFLAIDPGTTNLGWVFMEGEEILDCGLDTIWRDQPNVTVSLTKAAVEWLREHETMFAEAEQVFIEHQFQGKSMLQVFKPYTVMSALFAAAEYLWPNKVQLVSPSAVKAFFGIGGTYEERKAQVVKLAGLGNLEGRMHDIGDCILMIQYMQARNLANEERKKQLQAREAKRAAVRAKLLEKVPIKSREKSPTRANLSKQCKVCEELFPKLTKGACRKCYQRAYREKNKK